MTAKSLQLAEDWVREKVKYPVIYQPKIDGVRGANLHGTMTARSLRPFSNRHTTLFFSQRAFLGLDGELAAESEVHPRLCSLTTSATSTIEGEPWLLWHVFDLLTPETILLPYDARYAILEGRVARIKDESPILGSHLKLMPYGIANNEDELDYAIDMHIDMGYEGTIVRRANVPHKNGRSSPTHGGLLRIKGFIEVDAIVRQIIEGQRNQNEAKVNRLGHTERSTHAENMVPNGMVGSVVAELCEDAIHPASKKVLFPKGSMVTFSAGSMTHAERELYFREPHRILGKRMKGTIFPYGIKDKPRFPIFKSLRSEADTVNI